MGWKRVVIILILFFLFKCSALIAGDIPDGLIWLNATKKEKTIILLGYNRGASVGCLGLLEHSRKSDVFMECQNKFRTERDADKIINEVNNIYSDYKNRSVNLGIAIFAGKERASGKEFSVEEFRK